ncbi:MAG: hypothetical protein ACI8RW_000189 [Porticoccaceae bacterium]|jgi:hypothetical protein
MLNTDSTTLVALTIIISLFITIITTVLAAGVDAALKLMGALGTMFGVIVGAIGAHYFNAGKIEDANRVTDQVVRVAKTYEGQTKSLREILAKQRPLTNKLVLNSPQATAETDLAATFSGDFSGLLELEKEIDLTSSKLDNIVKMRLDQAADKNQL